MARQTLAEMHTHTYKDTQAESHAQNDTETHRKTHPQKDTPTDRHTHTYTPSGFTFRVCVFQILEDVCQKNNWGQPVYQLHSALGHDQRQLFLYKVTIPALATQYPNV